MTKFEALVIFFTICFFVYDTIGETDDLIEYYEKLINDSLKRYNETEIPTNARNFEVKETGEPKDFGLFDFVIVGAGASGTVVANRLSEIKDWKILLIDAGKFSNNFSQIPGYGFPALYNGYGWYYESTKQQHACLGNANQACPYPRGIGIGGSTLINGLVYARGNPLDFDKWAELGNPGWAYKDVLPYFIKSENFTRTDPQAPINYLYHGKAGYLTVQNHMPRSPFLNTFLEGFQDLGYNLTDYNSPKEIGVSPAQLNTNYGRREDGGSAFIVPILNRTNLKVATESYVIKIDIAEHTKRVTGICFSHNGQLHRARVGKEAIISGGSLSTPPILMHSGIGPKKHLESLDIPVIQDLPVGNSLLDHSMYFGLTFSSNKSLPVESLKQNIKEYLKGVGPLALSGPNEGVGFFQTSLENTTGYPDFELIVLPSNDLWPYLKKVLNIDDKVYESVTNGLDVNKSFTIFVINLHQHSRGTVRLRSKSPYDFALINSNFLSDPENHDVNVLYEGIQFTLKLLKTKAFKKIDAKLYMKPLPGCKEFELFSKDYWYCSLKYLTFNVYHPQGSCPMGPDPKKGYVVNHKLEVFGMKNLRVADASIIPLTTSGHPNAPCVMIGEKVSDFIKDKHLTS